jgi:membrane associated rhomboid family serine protease
VLALLFNFHIQQFGISPQNVSGLTGILFAPLIHGDWLHLTSNSLPIIILGTALFYGYPRSAKIDLAGIWLASGILTWLFARHGVTHYGASGLTHGFMFFLFTIGVIRRDRLAIVLAMIVFFLYGSMIWSIFPNKPGISFEMHLFGGLSGIVMAIILRNYDTALPTKKYSWDADDDLVGDEWKQDQDK